MGKISIGGLASGMDTDGMIKELMSVQNMKVDRYRKKNMMNDYRQEEWKKMNSKIYSFYNKDLTAFRLKATFVKHQVSSSNSSVADVKADAKALKGTHEIEVLQLAKTASTYSGEIKAGGKAITESTTMDDLGLAGKSLEIHYVDEQGADQTLTVTAEGTDTLSKFADKIQTKTKGKIDLLANADIKNGRIFMASKKTGEKQNFRLSGEVATALGFSTSEVKGVDAKYKYNNLEFTSDSNEVSVNGLKATLKSVGKTTVSVHKDVEGAYKQVIDFLKQYNALVGEMQDKVKVRIARSQRDMMPMTDEEKKAAGEAVAKQWEQTLRGRVFKDDANLKGVISDMRTVFATTSLEDNGKYNALSSLGIGTGEYNQGTGALLFVDGDSELGAKRADLPNKLKAALEDDPEAVAELLTTLGNKLQEKLSDRMKSTSLRSYMSFYDDKAAKEEYRSMENRIRTMEERMVDMEERYRKQFLAMERAISKANSTSSWLTQQLGGMQ